MVNHLPELDELGQREREGEEGEGEVREINPPVLATVIMLMFPTGLGFCCLFNSAQFMPACKCNGHYCDSRCPLSSAAL